MHIRLSQKEYKSYISLTSMNIDVSSDDKGGNLVKKNSKTSSTEYRAQSAEYRVRITE